MVHDSCLSKRLCWEGGSWGGGEILEIIIQINYFKELSLRSGRLEDKCKRRWRQGETGEDSNEDFMYFWGFSFVSCVDFSRLSRMIAFLVNSGGFCLPSSFLMFWRDLLSTLSQLEWWGTKSAVLQKEIQVHLKLLRSYFTWMTHTV